jgi:hypothetical protein
MTVKLKLGIALFILGLFGVLTMLTVTMTLNSLPKEVLEKISPETLKYLVLINPYNFITIRGFNWNATL